MTDLKVKTTCLVLALVLSTGIVLPVSAGLFGSIGNALGISGDIGKGLSFADGFLPGGGGPTDSILGAPAKATFGEAINKWSDANDKSIGKLGETNDRTVAKLLQGLEAVSTTLQATLTSTVEDLDAALSTSVAALDESLEKNVEKLDNSLTDQTQRLDTVFQKQISTFFFLGRVLLTVAIFSGLIYSAYKIALAAPDINSFGQIFVKRRVGVISSLIITAVALAVAWLVPDPGRLKQLEERYTKTYGRSLRIEDFANAQYSASQLTILRPDSALYRAWNLKSAALRDLVLRPTMLTSEEKVNGLYVRLGQVNAYRQEIKLPPDADVIFTVALIDAVKAKTELDHAAAALAMTYARDLAAKQRDDESLSIEHFEQLSNDIVAHMRRVAIPIELLRDATQGKPLVSLDQLEAALYEDGRLAFIKNYEAFALVASGGPEKRAMKTSPALSLSSSSFTEIANTVRQKLVIRLFYRNLTAKYYLYLDALAKANAPGAAVEMQHRAITAYCSLNVFYSQWFDENYAKHGGSLSFTSNLLTGPFVILQRAISLNKTPNACAAIPDASIAAQANIVDRWLVPLTTLKMQQVGKGAVLLKTAAKVNFERQNGAFAEYEKAFAVLKDIQDPNIAQIGDQAAKLQKAEAVVNLAELSAILGIFVEIEGNMTPAVLALKKKYQTNGVVDDERWRRAYQAFLECRFGA
jgi:hypothetical protein